MATSRNLGRTSGAAGQDTSLAQALVAAEQAQQRLREAIDALPEGIVFLDSEGRYVLWNAKYAEIYAASADLFAPGARLSDTLRIGVERGDYPEATGREEQWIADRLALLDNPGVRHEQRLANGRCIMIEERKTSDGGTIGLRVDISELKDREEAFRLLFEGNPVPLLVYDPQGETIRAANEAAAEHFGYGSRDMQGMPASRLFAEGQWDEARDVLSSSHSHADLIWKMLPRAGGVLESVLFTRRSVVGGEPVTIISIFDVTERRRTEARMVHMARHDELTGLLNRSYCRELLHDLLAPGRVREAISVALIDLDHFKDVNDTYGHLVGDVLLAQAADRMLGLMPKGAVLCRIGGDEFAVIFHKSSREQVQFVLNAIGMVMAKPFFVRDHCLHIGATIGLAHSPLHSDEPETLLRYADLALYAAKGERRGSCRQFEPALDQAAQEKTRLETDLRDAIVKGCLNVHYQPLVNLESGEAEGYEALLRWTHPEWGAISPERFIPLAEEIGLIDTLGQFVLREACREARQWPDHTTVAVNVSPLQFRGGNLLNAVIQALASSGLPPHRLELEITEAVLMDKGTQVAATIRSLRQMGVGLAMDDFGTGYSSLRYLLSYPFTKIKIDKSFIANLDRDSNSCAIIRAVIGLGKHLGLTVTAEGIEDPAIHALLKDEGCAQGQGYLFGEARSAMELLLPDGLAEGRMARRSFP